jgi:hypothetical protein
MSNRRLLESYRILDSVHLLPFSIAEAIAEDKSDPSLDKVLKTKLLEQIGVHKVRAAYLKENAVHLVKFQV